MRSRLTTLLLVLFILSASLIFSAEAQELKLPQSIQKIEEYNKQQAEFYLTNLTFLVAFIAGILSIFSPCLLPTLPAFFAYTFKEKRNITKMTFVFFLGFSVVFVTFGLAASFIGQSLAELQQSYSWLIAIAGIFLLIFGFMMMAGRGFSSLIKPKAGFRNDTVGVFLLGFFFAIGWSACLGPVLAGVLLMASVLKTYFNAALLLFSYSVGIFIPLFILSFVFDKYNLKKILAGKEIEFMILKKKINTSLTNIIAGLLLIATGMVFIIFRGTAFFNSLSIFNPTRELFYSLQRGLIGLGYINIIGALALVAFIFILFVSLKKSKRDG